MLHPDLHQSAEVINTSIFSLDSIRFRLRSYLFWFLISPMLHLDLYQSAELINISIFRWIALDLDLNGTYRRKASPTGLFRFPYAVLKDKSKVRGDF